VNRHQHSNNRACLAIFGILALSLSATAEKVQAKSPSAAVPFKDYKVSCPFQQWTECRAHKLYHCATYKDCKTQCRGSIRRC